jgi:hypothetical protein
VDRYATLFKSLGATTRPGADPAALARVEKLLNVRLPAEFRDLYLATDGVEFPDLGFEITPVAVAGEYAGFLTKGFGYAPFTEANDSNPYTVCCDEPLTGFVVHLFHDDEPVLVCRTLGRFLDLIADLLRQARGLDEEELEDLDLRCDRVDGDLALELPERTPDDARVGAALVRHAERLDPIDVDRTTALHFAAQMFGPGHEADLGRVLELGNEYVRATVLKRWRALGTPAAAEMLRRDAEEFDRFVMELAAAVEAAGLQVRRQPDKPHAWSVEPGPIWPNLEMHFACRHDPRFRAGWLERVRRQVWANATDDPFEKLVRGGLVQWWVESQRGEWDHQGWLYFLRLAGSQCGPLPWERVGQLLEEEKRRYWERKRAADTGPSG